MRKTAKLIENMIEMGKERGLKAGDIAAKAGISSASLSRIRNTGRFSADTLERLLAAVNGDIHVSHCNTPQRTDVSSVASRLNAGRREHISALELQNFLTKFQPSAKAERAFSHLVGIIEELPVEQVHDLIIQGAATLPSLRRIAKYVGGEGATVRWINEQSTSKHTLA